MAQTCLKAYISSMAKRWLFGNVKSMKTYVCPVIKCFEMKCSQVVCLSKYERFSSDEQLSKGGFMEDDAEDVTWNVNVWEE